MVPGSQPISPVKKGCPAAIAGHFKFEMSKHENKQQQKSGYTEELAFVRSFFSLGSQETPNALYSRPTIFMQNLT